jgi:hypothetical protein
VGEKGILLAWVAGMGLLTWRELQLAPWRPPPPARYAAASGLYVLLGAVAAYQPAAPAAALAAWGFDLALFLQVLPEQVARPSKSKQAKQAAATSTTATKGVQLA